MGENQSKMSRRSFYSRSNSLRSFRDHEVRGLINYNLSCCVNALLQTFSATPELLDIFIKWNPPDSIEQRSLPYSLKNTLLSMKDTSLPFSHKGFMDCLYHHAIRRYTQQDADEIFHMILNLSQKQIEDRELAQEIRSLYEINLEAQVTCSECENKSRTPSSLLSLPLAIRDGENTLESCIDFLLQRQNLGNSERYYCQKCNKKQPLSHELKLVSLPPILCVHLKRFRIDHGITKKLTHRVTFPEVFHTSVFAATQSGNPDECYSLFAVILHTGSASFGHYTALIRSAQEEHTWYHADDSRVKPVTWEEVQDTYKGGETAYLLLYRKKSLELSG